MVSPLLLAFLGGMALGTCAGAIIIALCTIAKESDMACWRCPKCGEVIYD